MAKLEEKYHAFYDNDIKIDSKIEETLCTKAKITRSVPMVSLRSYQKLGRDLIISGKIKRVFDVLPRRAGKETTWWQVLIECAIRKPGSYAMVYPELAQGRKIIWNGAIQLMDEGKSIAFLDMIPRFLVTHRNSTDMTIRLWNGSIIQIIGSDKGTDKQRGTNFIGAVFSEFAYQDPRTYQNMMPMFRQNNGWVVLQTTFNGLNHAYHYMKTVSVLPLWFTRIETAETLKDNDGNRYITNEMIDEDRQAGMPEFLIQQEYYNIVSLNEESMYFAKAIKQMYDDNRIREDVVIPGERVLTACDLGQNDEFVIHLFQIPDYRKPTIIKTFSGSGTDKPYLYYLNEAKTYCVTHHLILDVNFAPHDVKNHNNTTQTPLEEARMNGFSVTPCPRPLNKLTAIADMNSMLYGSIIDKTHCKRLLECLSNYTKEYDEKLGLYKNKPLHNWASHGVDAYQTMTLAILNNLIPMANHGIVRYAD